MMILCLEVPDLVRLHDQLVTARDEPLFVPSEHVLAAGTLTTVSVRVDGSALQLDLPGKVTGFRTQRGAQLGGAGAWVRLEGGPLQEAISSLHVNTGDAPRTSLRRHSRHGVALPVTISKPIVRSASLTNISFGGMCLETLVAAPLGQIVQLTVEFRERPIPVFARIVWRDEKVGRTGMEFVFQNDRVRAAIEEEIRALADGARSVIYAQPTVLIVDDDRAILDALERMLNSIGYGTVTASTGAEAISIARRVHPALILLDVLMPSMNGVEVCRILKRDADTSNIPTILVSALPPEDLEVVLQESGAVAGISKPFRIPTITDVCRTILDFARLGEGTDAESDDEQRAHERLPMFTRVLFESEDLTCEALLRDASEEGLYLFSYWAEPAGTRGRVTLLSGMERPLHLDVEVVRQSNFGVRVDAPRGELPGMGLKVLPCDDLQAFAAWLTLQRKLNLENKLVLVVDDDRDNLNILGTQLSKAGYATILLDLPLSAVDAIVRSKPDLAIVDFMMPGLDGVRLCRQLKQNKRTNRVPVWLYSSLDPERLGKLAKAGRADGILAKGTRPSDVVARVRDFLETPSSPPVE